MRKSKSQEFAYSLIKGHIESGKWPNGFHLIEQDLADQLNMSRTPIREVIKRLIDEGFVSRTANKGVIVEQKTISQKEFIERTQLLELLCSQYLYQLQIREYSISQEALDYHFSDEVMKQTDQEELYVSLWKTLVAPLENQVMRQMILESVEKMRFVKFPNGTADFLYQETLKLFKKILVELNQQQYDQARKSLRVYVNRLNLELIDQQI